MHYIYVIQYKKDNRLYVGQTANPKRRWPTHINSANLVKNGGQSTGTIYISRAMAKYGIENFEFQIIEEWETQDEVDDAEIFWIEFFQCRGKGRGFNLSPGGLGPGLGAEHPNFGKVAPNRLFSHEQEQVICNRYTTEKLSITKLAEEYDCHESTIHKILQRHDVEILGNKILSKGKRHSPKTEFKKDQEAHNKLFSEEREKDICRQYLEDKLTTIQLGKMYGCHKSVISRMLERHGVSTRRGKVSQAQKENIIKDYSELKSGRLVAQKYNLTKSSVLRIVKKANKLLCV